MTSFSFWQDLVHDVPATDWCHIRDRRNDSFWGLRMTEPLHHLTICLGSENILYLWSNQGRRYEVSEFFLKLFSGICYEVLSSEILGCRNCSCIAAPGAPPHCHTPHCNDDLNKIIVQDISMVDLSKWAIWACKIIKMIIFPWTVLEGWLYTGRKVCQIGQNGLCMLTSILPTIYM